MKDNLPVIYRKMEIADIPFIIDSWTRSMWTANQHIANFRHFIHTRISKVLQHSDVLVAVSEEDPSIIYGYAVWEKDLLHWVYVKYPLRKMGLCTALLKKVPYTAKFFHSHTTAAGDKAIVKKIGSQLNYFVMERYEK